VKSKSNQRGITLIALVLIIVAVVLLGGILLNVMTKKQEVPNNQQVGTQDKQEEVDNEFVYEMEDGSKLNTSEEMQKTKTVGKLKISNVQLKETKGITTLLADVENTGGSETPEKMLQIEVIDKNGQVITTIRCPIDAVKPGEKVQLNTSVTADISNAYDFRVKE